MSVCLNIKNISLKKLSTILTCDPNGLPGGVIKNSNCIDYFLCLENSNCIDYG